MIKMYYTYVCMLNLQLLLGLRYFKSMLLTTMSTWVFPPVTSCIADLDSEPQQTKQEKNELAKLVNP